MRKIIIMGGSLLLCLAVWTYAMIVSSDTQHYQISSDQNGVCLTWTDSQRYVVNYYNQDQRDLFVPKKTIAEWKSFLQVATGINSIGLSDTYAYDWTDYYGEICGTYANCTHGITHGQWYDAEAPGCDEWRYCTTPCGEVSCWWPIACQY